MNIYIGNLNSKASEAQLNELFKQFGDVNSVKIITDRHNGESQGFGFVEMDKETDGIKAIDKLNNAKFMSQKIEVSEAM
ncbi:MAG: RNA-binding protein [Bacteroidetes bacterium]|nr:RNA-binding protein [Bacteroidota bacterium]